MAIRTIQEIPSDLPHAHLYLDDIEEISIILQDAAFNSAKSQRDRVDSEVLASVQDSGGDSLEVKKVLESRPAIRSADISYTVGKTMMDSITDLQTFGGSTTKLDIRVEPFGPTVMFSLFMSPQVQLHSLDAEHAWATYGKIKLVFDRRPLRIKNAVESFPGWFKWSVSLLLANSPLLFALLTPHYKHGLYLLIVYISILILVGYIILRPSRVFFVRSHERTRTSSEARRRDARQIIFLVIGAIISAVIGGLIAELIRHFLFK